MALPAIPSDPGKTYASVFQRQKRVLFHQDAQDIHTTPIWRRGTAPCSAFFDLSHRPVKSSDFKLTARKTIHTENSLGLKTHQENSKVLAEIFFKSEDIRAFHCNKVLHSTHSKSMVFLPSCLVIPFSV